MGTVYDLLLIDPHNYLILADESSDRLIIGTETVIGEQDQRNLGVVTEAYLQTQTVDPVIVTPIGEFELNSVVHLPNPTFVERILTMGANATVAVPVGGTVCIITPPAGNASVLTLKGVAGDTGFLLSSTQPSVIALGTAQNTILLDVSPAQVITFTFL
jgi:hypothetical protein